MIGKWDVFQMTVLLSDIIRYSEFTWQKSNWIYRKIEVEDGNAISWFLTAYQHIRMPFSYKYYKMARSEFD